MHVGDQTAPGAATVTTGTASAAPETLSFATLARHDDAATASGTPGGLLLSLPPDLAGLVRRAALARASTARALALDVLRIVFGEDLLAAVLEG